MNKDELKAKLLEEGFEAAHIDEVTHDAASLLATNANNAGVDGQIDFLNEVCGMSYDLIYTTIKGE